MKKHEAISADRISALPEPIVHLILSLLPTKSVKLASSLSKTWYAFSSSFPYLDFTHYNFVVRKSEYYISDPTLEPLCDRFFNHIGETLSRFHARNPRILIRRIIIPISLINSRFVTLLRDWIRLALEHGVEEIDIKTRSCNFNLPGEVFASNSLRVLKLKGSILLESFANVDISSKLRKLVINEVYIDELTLGSVISICLLMEKLEIENAVGLRNLRISRLHNLKSLLFNNFDNCYTEMVEVDAPMLHCLEISIGFGNPPCTIGILECPRLAKLSLSDVEVENFQLEEILSRLPFLKNLRLTRLLLLTKFKITSDSLNQLVISECTKLLELEIEAPKMLLFKFDCDLVPLMAPMHTIMGLSYITLYIGWKSWLYDNFAVKFSDFLSRLDRVKYVCFVSQQFSNI